MIKRRSRPQTVVREKSSEATTPNPDAPESAARDGSEDISEDSVVPENEEEARLPLADLIELRKLRKGRQGIDVNKLNIGDIKKKKKKQPEEVQGGLREGFKDHDEDDEENEEAKARRVVRSNNFTQQTNALDVDKHMMAYIEENLKIRSRPRDDEDDDQRPLDPQEALYQLSDKWKSVAGEKPKKQAEEGSVTNSMTMLTAIPEVDLGMDARLKNIEETEKAKRVVAENRYDRKRPNTDEEHLVASRFYRPNLKTKSDAEIMRDAKLEAMGLPPQDHDHSRQAPRPQMATDEIVMERFKKRMRK
ncbi:hypothetical protein AX16_003107 [Volvariella volvacea WC 439]|nr:hypothetical protein AX16_003107 [Volvariella volvacea WC 439]